MASYPQLRPNGTAVQTSWNGGTGHVITSDNDDGTYLTSIGTGLANLEMDFTSYTLAGDQRCAGARLVSRISSSSHGFDFFIDTWLRPQVMGDGGGAAYTGPYNGFTPLWNPWYVAEFDQNAINNLRGCYRNDGGRGVTNAALSESYIDLDVRTRPTVTITSPTTDQRLFTTQPTVNWNYNAQGDAVAGHRVKVFTNAVVTGGGFNPDVSATVWDSGDVGGAANSKQSGAALTYGQTYWFYVQVATDFLGSWWRSSWAAVRFIINTPPNLTGLGTNPATPITTTNRPNITGTYNDTDGNASTQFQVKVFSEAQAGYAGGGAVDTSPSTWDNTSGLVIANGAAFSIQVGVPLTPNTNYRAYVRATEESSVTRWSAWAGTATFVITTAPGTVSDPPAPPEVTAVQTDQTLQRLVVSVQGRDNLLNRNQATIDTGQVTAAPAGWENIGNGALTRETTTFLAGGGALRQTTAWAAGGALDMTARSGAGGQAAMPVTAGRTYTGIAWSRAAQAQTRSTRVDIRWYDAAGATLSTSSGTASANAQGGWAVRTVTAVAPANAAYAALLLVTLATAVAAEAHLWDLMDFAPGSLTDWTRGGLAWETGQLTDSFTRADSAATLGTADVGGAWSALGGTWGISGNQAYMVTATDGSDHSAVLTSGTLADGYVEADIKLGTARGVAGLVFRANDANNLLMVELAKHASTDSITLYKRVAGTWTALTTVATAGLVAGTTYKLRVEFYGGQIYVYLNGSLRASQLLLAGEHNQFGSYQKYGIRVYRHSTTGSDADVRFDNFKAGAPATQRVTLQRSLDAGVTWENVRTAVDMNLGPSQQGIVYDYEVPAGQLAQYRAVTTGSEAGNTVTSPYSAIMAQSVELVNSQWWLKDAVDPSLNMVIDVAPPFDFRRKEPQATFDPFGRKESVFVSDGAKGIEGSLNVWVKNRTTYEKLVAILGNGRAVLLNDPLGYSWWVKFADQEWSLMRAVPDAGETTPIRHLHALALPFTEVAAPAVV